MKCCLIRDVDNMMQTADKICRFFNNSPKRQILLEGWIESTMPKINRKRLKELCRTRWIERHEAFEVFLDLFLPIFGSFEAIVSSPASDWNRESHSDAQSFLLAMSQFPFIAALVVTQKILAYIKGLSVKLQGWYTDVVGAHQEVEIVKSTLFHVQSGVDSFHAKVYDQVTQLSQSIEVVETTPRQTSKQHQRQNIPSTNVSEYYKRNLTIPLLDHLCN